MKPSDQQPLGKIYISVDEGSIDDSNGEMQGVLSRAAGVYCVLYLGKQRAKTPTCTNLAALGWSAFEFEFSNYEYCNKLSVSLFAKLEGTSDEMLCSWGEETELVEDGNYERWVSLIGGDGDERCKLRLHLRMEQLQPFGNVVLKDFDMLTAIGEGAFGKVMTVRKKDDGKIYAMKILEKGRVTSKRQLGRMLGERNILMKIRSHFIVGLHYAFESSDKVYLVLDFVGGGDLFHHLRMHKKFSEECVRFWAAEICLALEELHGMNIVYRDLKPENILLEPDGHVVLVDFGLAKLMTGCSVEGVEGRSNSFVGTPEYLAPEIVQGTGHGASVDWWTFGILVFELLLGKPPFKSKDLSVLYQKIVSEDVTVPNSISAVSRSLLRGLLSRNPNNRLGAQGAQHVKEHQFFQTCDWNTFAKKGVKPPYQPLSPEDYLSKVISSIGDDSSPDSTPAKANLDPKATDQRKPEYSTAAAKISAEELPDYFDRIVKLIDKWQQRIMNIPMDTPQNNKIGTPNSRHSTGSWRLTPDAALALESMTMQRTLVTAHKNKHTTSKKCVDEQQLTPLPSPIAKPVGVEDAPPTTPIFLSPDQEQAGILVPQSPGMLVGGESPLTGPPPNTPVMPDPGVPLHGLLFGHEVQMLESILREMQSTLETQAAELHETKVALRDVTAERDVMRCAPKNSGDSHDLTNALAIAMEETESLVSLAHKMATAMSSTVGPGSSEICDILTEAEKLMGLAREERTQAEQERLKRDQAIEVAKHEHDKKAHMADMQQQFAMTEEGYIQAMVESQQTLATAAAEREALLRLASKLEEHSRLQAQREGDLVATLAEKTQALAQTRLELKRFQELEIQWKEHQRKDKTENARLKQQLAQIRAKLQQYEALDVALEQYGEVSSSSEQSDDEEEGDEENLSGSQKENKGSWFRGWFSGLSNNKSSIEDGDEVHVSLPPEKVAGVDDDDDEEQRLSTPRTSDPSARDSPMPPQLDEAESHQQHTKPKKVREQDSKPKLEKKEKKEKRKKKDKEK